MDLNKKLEETKDRRRKLVDELNELATEIEQIQSRRQLLLQEALRCDGEARALESLIKEEGTENAQGE